MREEPTNHHEANDFGRCIQLRSFLLVRTALHRQTGAFDPIDGVADYLTVGITILCFAVILNRLRLGTWTREQEDYLLSIDDETF